MKRAGIIFYCVLLTVSCILTGCGKAAKKGPEIMMWLIGSEDQAITINEIAADFYNRTKIRVRCEALSWGDAHSKYLTSIAGGVAPDIGTMGLTWGSEFGNLGGVVDLKRLYPDEINTIKDATFPGLWNSIEYKDKVYGIPFDMTLYVMYYRNDIVTKPPETWEELTKKLEELNRGGKGMLFDWGSLNWIGYSPFLWQAGGDFFNNDYSKTTIDSPAAARAMSFFSELYTKYGVPKTKIPLEQGLRTGDFPIAISGNWMIDGLRLGAPEIAGRWSIAVLPKGPAGKSTAFIGGRIMGIFEQSKNKRSAWEFIKFLYSSEVQQRMYEAALTKQDTYLPPRIKTWNTLNMQQNLKDVLVAQAHDAKGPPPVAKWDSISRYIDEAIQKVVFQGKDPSKELSQAKKEIETFINR